MSRVKKVSLKANKDSTNVQKDESIVLVDYVKETDELIKNKIDADGAKKQIDVFRKKLEPIAKDAQLNAEKSGKFATKVLFQGSNQRACFTFTNSLGALDQDSKNLVVKAIGEEAFSMLFEPEKVCSIRSGKFEDLREAIVGAGLDPADYFDEDIIYSPVKDFRRVRFNSRCLLKNDQNDALDLVIDQIADRPSMTIH